jgi:hypothetical protein
MRKLGGILEREEDLPPDMRAPFTEKLRSVRLNMEDKKIFGGDPTTKALNQSMSKANVCLIRQLKIDEGAIKPTCKTDL